MHTYTYLPRSYKKIFSLVSGVASAVTTNLTLAHDTFQPHAHFMTPLLHSPVTISILALSVATLCYAVRKILK